MISGRSLCSQTCSDKLSCENMRQQNNRRRKTKMNVLYLPILTLNNMCCMDGIKIKLLHQSSDAAVYMIIYFFRNKPHHLIRTGKHAHNPVLMYHPIRDSTSSLFQKQRSSIEHRPAV